MPLDYPLRFQPLFRQYLWGGRRLEAVLRKSLGPGDDFAESWEIVDHGPDQSVVAAGPLAGQTLGQLLLRHPRELFGAGHEQPHFPLLFKFLDAHQSLSVQVHPNDRQAAQLTPPDLGKTEAWVVLHADPGSLIYAGLKTGVDRSALTAAIDAGETESCLHRFAPQAGDCVFIPAGTIHALGAGLVIAETQQSSDTTFRLFDWNRVGKDGQPRPLHIDAALDVIDFDRGPVTPQQPEAVDRDHVERLVACDKFVLDRWKLTSPQTWGGDGRFHIMAVVSGQITVQRDAEDQPLHKGQTLLLPAAAGGVQLRPVGGPATVLDIWVAGP